VIKILIGIISRLIGYTVPQRLLKGYIYIVEDVLCGTIRVGSVISLTKLDNIQRAYYGDNKYRVKVIHKTSSQLHKQRRDRLNELQNYYVNKFSSQYKVVLLI
jgi:hypothetical protein